MFGANPKQHSAPLFSNMLQHCMCMPDIGKDWGIIEDENKWDGAKHRQNPREKPASVCFIPDTGRGIHLSAG